MDSTVHITTASRRKQARGRTPSGKPNPVDVHVGARIRQRRVMQGLTQEQLAEALGLTFQQVQKYERGANRVGASRLFDLSRVLDVPVGFFFDDMGDDTKAASPAAMATATADPVIDILDTRLGDRETLDLVRAYYRIADPSIRGKVYDLAKALAGAHHHAAE